MTVEKINRLYGVDVARSIAILLVVVFHVNGVFSGFDGTKLGRLITAGTICCVDLFAIISGYVGITSKFRWSRIVNLWAQVVFTGIVIVCAGTAVGFFLPTLKDWGKVFLPISSHSYWYLTEYFGLFLLAPFINSGFCVLSRKMIVQLSFIIIIFIIVLPALNPYAGDTYALGNGLSVIWLVLCYILGGAIRVVDTGFGNFLFWCTMTVVSIFFSWSHIGGYSHPFVLTTAICYFLTCMRVHISDGRLARLILLLSTCSFGVYIWHVQPLLYETMAGRLSFICRAGAFVGGLQTVACSIVLLMVCVILEYFRIRLFRFLHVNDYVRKVDILTGNAR